MEYWNIGKHQFHCSGNHSQPILPAFQPSNIPEFKQYHQSLFKSIPNSSLSFKVQKCIGLGEFKIEKCIG
jgi:hypothetical protein